MSLDVEAAVRTYIDNTYHLSLATMSQSGPWVVEVHFAYSDDLTLYFRSLESRRHSKEIAANSRVAGNIIDKYGLGDAVVGLYFEGQAHKLTDTAAMAQAYEALSARLGLANDILVEAARPDGHKLYRISVSDWYVFGRFGSESGQKYHLPWQNPPVMPN